MNSAYETLYKISAFSHKKKEKKKHLIGFFKTFHGAKTIREIHKEKSLGTESLHNNESFFLTDGGDDSSSEEEGGTEVPEARLIERIPRWIHTRADR